MATLMAKRGFLLASSAVAAVVSAKLGCVHGFGYFDGS